VTGLSRQSAALALTTKLDDNQEVRTNAHKNNPSINKMAVC